MLAAVTIITLTSRGTLHPVTSGARAVAADAIRPIQEGVNAVVEPIGSFVAGSVHYGAAKEQNQKLQAEIARLRIQQQAAADQSQALAQLSALLHLPFVADLQTVPTEVTNFGTSDFAATIDIGAGRSDGVQVGMPVVASGGLVGRVVMAGHHTATVRLVTDGQSVVGVRYGSGALAVAEGQGWGKPLTTSLIPAQTPLSVGSVFVTSGLQGAIFPPGIPVATASSVQNSSASVEESVSLRPVVDLAHLRYVSVVLWGPGS